MFHKVNAVALYLKEQGFELVGVPGDGDCFFHAFMKSYTSQSQKIPILEDQLNPIEYLRHMTAKQYRVLGKGSETMRSKRAEEIRKDGTWISSQEGDLLATVLSIPIRIITVNHENGVSGINDMVTFSEKEREALEWQRLNLQSKPQNYIFIIDLVGHFVAARRIA
jgi:hypothetical protein